MRVAGVMSGTRSTALMSPLSISGAKDGKNVTPVVCRTVPYPRRVRQALLELSNAETHVGNLARLHTLLGELYRRDPDRVPA
jgi:hypothetical protein